MLRQMMQAPLALLSAVLLSLCFPSAGLWWLAWVSLAPLLVATASCDIKRAFGLGYLAGAVFFFLTLFWIHHVTFIGLVLLSAYLALYWALFAGVVAWSARWPLMRRVMFLPAVWVVAEYVRAHAFTGFGWSALAHTQSKNILLIQVADLTGTYGVSFIVMAFNVVVAGLCRVSSSPAKSMRGAFWGVVLVLVAALGYGACRLSLVPGQGDVRVALVQGNVSLGDYWSPALKSYVVEKYLALSQEALAQAPDLIVWPETAFPQFIWEYPDLFEKVRAFARDNHIKLLLGTVTRTGEQYFNAALLVNEDGEIAGEYRKQHLVILGEYIPFRDTFPWLARFVPIDDFTPGDRQVLFHAGSSKAFAALICFEDTVPELARGAVNAGAGFLVNITNDAWFGASRQPAMHLDNAVFRAVENRVGFVRATNTGMSCAILPTGHVGACVEGPSGEKVRVAGVRVVDLPGKGDENTIYRKFGDIFTMLCFAGILGAIAREKFIRENTNV